MAVDDSVIIIEGSTAERIATDFVTAGSTSAHYQYMKVAWGADGTATPVSATTGTHLPVQLYIGGSAVTSTGNALDVNLKTSDITVNTNGRGLTAEYTAGGGTYSGDIVGVTGEVTITDTVTVKGSGNSADKLYVSGYEGMTALFVAATGDFGVGGGFQIRGLSYSDSLGTGDIVGVSGEVRANIVASGVTLGITFDTATTFPITTGTLGVTWDAGTQVDANITNTDLDIRGLSMGVHGSTAMHVAASTDTVIVQGVTKAYPVAVHLTGISGDGNQYPVGISGDELKVSFSNGTVSATITDTDINLATVAGGVTIGITFDDGTIFPISSGVTLGITWDAGTEVDANITNASLAVTSTDLDIRALNSADTITAMGFTGPAGLSAMPSILFSSAGLTAMPLGVTEGKNQINGVTVDLLHVRVEGSGITNATAFQVQGRNDGLTLFPVSIIGTTGRGGVELGVTFDNSGVQTVVGAGVTAHNSPYLNSLMVGVSAPNIAGEGNEAIVPVGISGGALNVNLVNSDTVTITGTVEASTTVANAGHKSSVPISGASAAHTGSVGDGVLGVFVSGTAGSTHAIPIMVQGYTTDSGFDAPIGVTFEFKHELQGLSGGITALHNALVGVTQEIGGLASTFTTTNTELVNLNSNITTTNSNLNTMVNAYVSGSSPATIPVSVAAPTDVQTYQFAATDTAILAHGTADDANANSNAFSSGIKIKLHPDATQPIFVGGPTVTVTTGYLLSPGDDIFIEQQFTSGVGIITTAGGANMMVYVIGY